MAKLKIGVVGGGGIANTHLPHLKKREEAVELVGVADVNPEAARETAAKYDMARHTTKYGELLADVDAVLICVPTHLHAEIATQALDAGKSVFCEKPLARTLEQADAMMTAAKHSGAPLQVGFVRRFDDEWNAWRDAVCDGKIGRPVVWRDVLSTKGGRGIAWFNQDEKGGGPFLDGCIHNIDFALHTFGPVAWVFCHGRTLSPDNTAIDTGTATLRFESGDELLLAWSWGLPRGCKGGRVFEVFGPRGTITWPEAQPSEAAEKYFVINNGEHSEEVRFAARSIGQAFARQMDEFIAVAQGQVVPRAGAAQGRAALQVALSILESARSAEVVRL